MQGEQKHAHDIECGDVNILKSVNHHGKDIVMVEGILLEEGEARIGHAHREMRDVINEKGEDDEAAQHHVAGGHRRLHIVAFHIPVGARAAVLNGQSDRRVNVNRHRDDEKHANGPKQRPQLAQMLGITVDPGRPEEDLQIPEQMSDDEKNENDARERDDDFSANRRAMEGGKSGHGRYSAAGWRAERFETINRDWSVKMLVREREGA
jgi:hypothetical protein